MGINSNSMISWRLAKVAFSCETQLMESFKTKVRWSFRYSIKILVELLKDLWAYYFTPYPLLLILDSIRRIMRRLKIIWLAKPKGRPPIHENVVDLILEMKRCNQNWGAQRISDELQLMGIKVSKKTVLLRKLRFGTLQAVVFSTGPRLSGRNEGHCALNTKNTVCH